MNTIFGSNTSLRFLAGLACLVVVVAGIREASGIIIDIMVAIFVAISCAPLLNLVKKTSGAQHTGHSSDYLQSVLTFRCYGGCWHFSVVMSLLSDRSSQLLRPFF